MTLEEKLTSVDRGDYFQYRMKILEISWDRYLQNPKDLKSIKKRVRPFMDEDLYQEFKVLVSLEESKLIEWIKDAPYSALPFKVSLWVSLKRFFLLFTKNSKSDKNSEVLRFFVELHGEFKNDWDLVRAYYSSFNPAMSAYFSINYDEFN